MPSTQSVDHSDVVRAFGAYEQALAHHRSSEQAKVAAREAVHAAVDSALFRVDPMSLCAAGVFAPAVVADVLRRRLREVEKAAGL